MVLSMPKCPAIGVSWCSEINCRLSSSAAGGMYSWVLSPSVREWRQRVASQPASQPVTLSGGCPASGEEPAPGAAHVRRSRRRVGQPSGAR